MKSFQEFLTDCPDIHHIIHYIREYLPSNGFTEKRLESIDGKDTPNFGFCITTNDNILLWKFVSPFETIDPVIYTIGSNELSVMPNCELFENGLHAINIATNVAVNSIIEANLFKISGKILINKNGQLEERLYNSKKGVAYVPGLPLHYMFRKVSAQGELDVVHAIVGKTPFLEALSKDIGVDKKDILSYNLFLTDSTPVFANETTTTGPNAAQYLPIYSALMNLTRDVPVNQFIIIENKSIESETYRQLFKNIKAASPLYIIKSNCSTNKLGDVIKYGPNDKIFLMRNINESFSEPKGFLSVSTMCPDFFRSTVANSSIESVMNKLMENFATSF